MMDPDDSGGGLDVELQQLWERVAQLQVENERLLGAQGSDAGGSGALPVRREQAVYLPRERLCSKFSGSVTAGSLSIEE